MRVWVILPEYPGALVFCRSRSAESARENICSVLAFRKSLEKERLSINKCFGCIYAKKSSVKLAFSTPKMNGCNENSLQAHWGDPGLLNVKCGTVQGPWVPFDWFEIGIFAKLTTQTLGRKD